MSNQTNKEKIKKTIKIPRPRQKKLAKAFIENATLDKPKPLKDVLSSVGYGTGLQHNPQRVLESEGFKLALAEYGLTEELITTSLVEDIKGKPKQRVKELGLGAEILGMKKREEPVQNNQQNVYNFVYSPQIMEDIKEIDDKIKQKLLNKDVQ